MRILNFRAENIKKLVVVEIEPKGNMVQITGRNGAGKTSVLDSIWWALAGTRNHQPIPIRKGQKQATIELDLGKIIVKRKFSLQDEDRVTTQITVENKEGARFPSPQKMLDDLIGSLSFDPLAFCRMNASEQYRKLQEVVGVNLDSYDAAQKDDFMERRQKNRRAKELRAAAVQVVIPEGTPAELVSVAELAEKLKLGDQHNRDLRREENRRGELSKEVTKLESSIAIQRLAIHDLEEQQLQLFSQIQEAKSISVAKKLEKEAKQQNFDSLASLPDPFDPVPIQSQIAESEAINDQVRKLHGRDDLNRQAEGVEAESQTLTDKMAARKAAIQQEIEKSDMPVPGLTLGDGTVTLDGIPFDQASDAEQLRTSCAIAMRGNPKLRVLRIRDGSLMDEDSLALLQEMAISEDFQLWVERVDTSGKVGIVIEDGKVKESSQ